MLLAPGRRAWRTLPWVVAQGTCLNTCPRTGIPTLNALQMKRAQKASLVQQSLLWTLKQRQQQLSVKILQSRLMQMESLVKEKRLIWLLEQRLNNWVNGLLICINVYYKHALNTSEFCKFTCFLLYRLLQVKFLTIYWCTPFEEHLAWMWTKYVLWL